MSERKSVIQERAFGFAIQIVACYRYLVAEKREFVLSKQLLRSGTSVGANVREAQNAESPADFIHKLKIAQKEIDETIYWLELLHATNYLPENQFTPLQNEGIQLLKMLKSAILTTQTKHPK